MPQVDWSIDIGGIIMGVVALVFLPVARMLMTTLWQMRDALRDLGHVVLGSREGDTTGLVTRVHQTEGEIRRHRDRLINLEVDAGLKIRDRT